MFDQDEGCGLTIAGVLLLGMVSLAFWSGYKKGLEKGNETGYIQACKDIAAGKLRAELRTFPGGEKKWFLKTEKEVGNED